MVNEADEVAALEIFLSFGTSDLTNMQSELSNMQFELSYKQKVVKSYKSV